MFNYHLGHFFCLSCLYKEIFKITFKPNTVCLKIYIQHLKPTDAQVM